MERSLTDCLYIFSQPSKQITDLLFMIDNNHSAHDNTLHTPQNKNSLIKISETKKTSLRIIFMKKNIFLREHNSFFSWKKIFSFMKRIWITWINNIKGHHKYARNLLWLRDEKTTYSLWIYHDYAYICTWRQLLPT